MKKITLISTTLLMGFLLAGCTAHHTEEHAESQHSTRSSKTHPSTTSKKFTNKIDLHKKYKGFKLATIPTQYRGTWYRANAYEKNATKLVITTHTVNGAAAYQQTDPNLKLNRHSEKQNKEYAGNAVVVKNVNNSLKVRGFLDPVNLVYRPGQFKGQPCLFMSYGTNPKATNGAVFKNKAAALKYRKFDFSKVN